ncbi:CBS domain-containing protein [Salipiger mucosus]|uniref:Inosine-5'-monophosphate dehydrogenase (GuaB) n=1 Tax=Salipiger mucosus DSM 16094 TaxID=1123237 RepID=S9QEX6_9RHOB|nr:CBS domain-containing protein [Salipiger mucosus]EPX78467.1 inosine-5'-monophosphate dehydrogenase (guaB) [Salipiger mucosus DSM 16094]
MAATNHYSMQLRDRPEYASKPAPLTFSPETPVAEAVAAMNERNYGSVVVVDAEDKVQGIVTERDVLRKLVGAGRAATETRLSEIMTANPRVARETDEVIDWLRIMSNERFRRLPVVDEAGRIRMIFTQGDFVSYTWPDLIYQAKELAKASVGRNYPVWLIGGGIMLYSILMVIVVASII